MGLLAWVCFWGAWVGLLGRIGWVWAGAALTPRGRMLLGDLRRARADERRMEDGVLVSHEGADDPALGSGRQTREESRSTRKRAGHGVSEAAIAMAGDRWRDRAKQRGAHSSIPPRLLAVLAALLCVLLPAAASADEGDRKPDPPAPDACLQRASAPILSAARVDAPSAWDLPTATTARQAGERLGSALTVLQEQGGVRALIATVPDPIDSGFVYFHERSVRAIELALERLGYLRDEEWTPWAGAHLPMGWGKEKDEACRRHVPGVIVFRGSTPTSAKTLLLFVVGETPTHGVTEGAMFEAARLARLATSAAPESELAIVGPTFSGSAASMATAIVGDARSTTPRQIEAPSAPLRVRIVTGSASRKSVATALAAQLPQPSREPMLWALRAPPPHTPRLDVSFTSTAISEETAEDLFFAWLATHEGWGPGPRDFASVAVLAEAGTAFGVGSGPWDGGNSRVWAQVARFEFPRGVSDMRVRYERAEKVGAKDDGGKEGARKKVPSVALEVVLEERLQRRPEDQAFSPKSVSARDLVLQGQLEEIARRQVRFLVLRATDPADVLFLAQRVRDLSPDVRLVLIDNDVLFQHPKFRHMLRGSYVVTPYPFLGQGAFRHPSPGSRAGFESQGAQGAFNATIVALDRSGTARDLVEEYAFPLSLSDPPSGITPSAVLPLWIGVLGDTGLVPIGVLDTARELRSTATSAGDEPPSYGHLNLGLKTNGPSWEARGPRVGSAGSGTEPSAWLAANDERDVPGEWTLLLAALLAAFVGHLAVGLLRVSREHQRDLSASRAPGSVSASRTWLGHYWNQTLLRDRYDIVGRFYVWLRWLVLAAIVGYAIHVNRLVAKLHGGSAVSLLPAILQGCLWTAWLVLGAGAFWVWPGQVIVLRWRALVRDVKAVRSWSTPTVPIQTWTAVSSVLRERWRRRREEWCVHRGAGNIPPWVVSYMEIAFVGILPAVAALVLLKRGSMAGGTIDEGWSKLVSYLREQAPWAPVRVSTQEVLYARRLTEVLAGVSPAAPLAVAAFAGYRWFSDRIERHTLFRSLAALVTRSRAGSVVAHDVDSQLPTPLSSILVPAEQQVDDAPCGQSQLRASGKRIEGGLVLDPPHREVDDGSTEGGRRLNRCGLNGDPTLWLLRRGGPPSGYANGAANPVTWPSPSDDGLDYRGDVRAIEMQLARVIEQPFRIAPYWIAALIAFGVTAVAFHLKAPTSLESARETGLLVLPLFMSTAVAALTSVHLCVYWNALDRLLRRLTIWRQLDCIDRVAPPLARPLIVEVTRRADDAVRLLACADAFRTLVTTATSAIDPRLEAWQMAALCARLRELGDEGRGLLDRRAAGFSPDPLDAEAFGSALTRAAAFVHALLDGLPVAPLPVEGRASEPAWAPHARAFVGSVVALALGRYVRFFRYFMTSAVVACLGSIAMFACYAFEPRRLILTVIWIATSAVLAAGAYVFVGMTRNRLLARIARDSASRFEVSRDALYRVFTWVVLPVLGLLAAQYPNLGGTLVAWLDPVGAALK